MPTTEQALVRLGRAAYGVAPSGLRAWARDAVSSTGSVTTTEPVFALTLDDGPDPDVTPRVLDALARAHWRATFFVVAERAEKYQDITRRIVDEGHEVGLHAMTHALLPTQRPAGKARLILEGKRRLRAVASTPVRAFRPPFGQLDITSFAFARLGGMDVIAWSAQVDDWLAQPIETLAERFLASVAPGAFMLAHDGLVTRPTDPPGPSPRERVEWLEMAIARSSKQGFVSQTVTEMLAVWPAKRFPWFPRLAA